MVEKNKKIKLIIFDLWKTLAYRGTKRTECSEMIEKANIKMPEKKFRKIFESSVQTKKWKTEFEAYKNLVKNLSLPTTKKNVKLFMEIRDKAENKIYLYSHSIKMLKQLKRQGYRIGLLSNSSVFAAEKVKHKTLLFKYIDYPLFSYQEKVIKPSLKGFKDMLKTARCKPKQAIMVGDKIDDDVCPAEKVGMHAIHFKNYQQLKKDFKRFGINI